MDMQAFYNVLSVKPVQGRPHQLANLRRASRAQILKATGESTWFVWGAQALDV